MELKEYYKIWRANISVVIYAILVLVVAAYVWSIKKSETYSASLLLNVSRTRHKSTAEYKYDQFYRLQADEKFAEVIVAWLKSPGIANEIFEKANLETGQKSMRGLQKSFQAEKTSSATVSVRYSAQNEDEAKKLSNAIYSVISNKTKNINAEARDPNWFSVDMSNLVILKNVQDLRVNLGIALVFGLFLGSLLAFGKHYITRE